MDEAEWVDENSSNQRDSLSLKAWQTVKCIETTMDKSQERKFKPAPSPWKNIRAQVLFSFARANHANGLPQGSYSDLEASAPFSDPEKSGKFEGGFSLIMIVRYLESPVGMHRSYPFFEPG
ncbi:unnamed protein product [Aspergillus oryzae]|nr:unnamed protein product [Aspergillus oryzae]